MSAYAAIVLGSVIARGMPTLSRWALRWHTVAFALIVPVCVLAVAEARLHRRT